MLQVSIDPNTINSDAQLLLTSTGSAVLNGDAIVVASSSGDPFRLLAVSFTVTEASSVVFELIDATTGSAQAAAPMPVR